MSYRTVIQGDSPLYYWPMDEAAGATSLAALVGSTAITLSTGGAAPTCGVAGQVDGTCVQFNGTTNWGQTAANLASISGLSKVVVEAVYWWDTNANTDNILFEYTASWFSLQGFIAAPNTSTGAASGKFYVGTQGNSGQNTAQFTRPSAAAWHHLAIVFDFSQAGTAEVTPYIDGVAVSYTKLNFVDNSGTYGSSKLNLFARNASSVFGAGRMQHLAIYSALTPTQIANHYSVAFAGPLTGGTLSKTSNTLTTASLSWTDSTAGVLPVTQQLQRSPGGANTWANVSGATASPFTDTSLSPGTAYDYRVLYTDSTPQTATSNTVTVTTTAGAQITFAASDLWDNGYDGTGNPTFSQSSFLRFTTDAATLDVVASSTIIPWYPQYAHLGVVINGVVQSPLVCTAASQTFTVSLGTAGTTRTVDILCGVQSKPSGSVLGTWPVSVYRSVTTHSIVAPFPVSRIVTYGDSIDAGADATNPETQGWNYLVRSLSGRSVLTEAWGSRNLNDDIGTSVGGVLSTTKSAALATRLASYTPTVLWICIGTNDFGLSPWSASVFGTAYADLIDRFHALRPSTVVYCQTPIVRSTEANANGWGNILADYRTQIATICGTRSPWARLLDGTQIVTLADLDDGVHPTVAGQAKYANYALSVLSGASGGGIGIGIGGMGIGL